MVNIESPPQNIDPQIAENLEEAEQMREKGIDQINVRYNEYEVVV